MASDLAREALAPEGVLPLRVNEMTPSVIICAEGSRISIQWREQRPDQPDHDEYGRAEAMAAFLVEAANRHGTAFDAIGSGVKALEWDALNQAETEIGTYSIVIVRDEDGGPAQLCVELDRPSFGISFVPTRDGATWEEVKAAVQADFERRVLSCLSTHTAAGAVPVGGAVAWRYRFPIGDGWSDWKLTEDESYAREYVGERGEVEPLYVARTVEEPGEVEGSR